MAGIGVFGPLPGTAYARRDAAAALVAFLVLGCTANARYVPAYVVPLTPRTASGGSGPFQQLLMHMQLGSYPSQLECAVDTSSGYLFVPGPQVCPAGQGLYSPSSSTTAGPGEFPTKSPWEQQGPADAPVCTDTDVAFGDGSIAATCGFNTSTWQAGQELEGVAVTDQLQFGAGLTGFGTWNDVDIKVVAGAVDSAQDPSELCAPPAAAICGMNTGPAGMLRQVVQLAPAGVDMGMSICTSAQQPNSSFMVVGLGGGGVSQFATTELQPGSLGTGVEHYSYWVDLMGFSLGGTASAAALNSTMSLLSTGAPHLMLPSAVVDAYSAAVQAVVAADPELTLTSASPLTVTGPSLEAVSAAFPNLTLHLAGNASVDIPKESFIAVSESNSSITIAATALEAVPAGQRVILGLPTFYDRFTLLGNGRAGFSELLGAQTCSGLTGGAPMGPPSSAGRPLLAGTAHALLAAALGMLCWL